MCAPNMAENLTACTHVDLLSVKSNDAKKVQEQEIMLTDFNLSMVEDDDSSDEEGGVGQCDGKKI